jgi:hypothetical protein
MNLKTLTLIFIVTFALYNTKAQDFYSASDIALANSNTAKIFTNSFVHQTNPSLSFFNRTLEFGATYTPGLYNLTELQNFGFAVTYPFKYSNISFSLNNFGYSLYQKNLFSFNYSYFIDKLFIFGFNSNLDYVKIANYDNHWQNFFDLGISSILTNNLVMSFSVKNIFNQSHIINEKDIPSIYSLGISSILDGFSTLNFSVQKEISKNVNFMGGISLFPIDILSLNIGYMKELALQSYGFSLFINKFSLEYSLQIHNLLGETHYISIFYNPDGFLNKYDIVINNYLK